MIDIETRSFDQLPLATALAPTDLITMQPPEGPVRKISVGQVFALFQNCDIALETVAELTTNAAAIALPVQSLAVVYANPDATQSGYWVKTSAAGSGVWALTDIQYGYSAAFAGQAQDARDAAAAFANFVPGSREAAEAATDVGGLFSIADAGTVVAYVRTLDGSDEVARVATQAEMLARARTAIHRVALAALPAPVIGQTAILAEAFREGVFTAVNYDDVATMLAADVQQGVYVRSTADPDIVWQRRLDAGELDVRWFGAVPDAIIDPDGTIVSGTSCHVAFFGARALGLASGKPFTIVFQGGDFFTTAALRFISDMTVIVRGSHVFGMAAGLTNSLGHQQRSVFTMAGVELGSPASGTGDYYETVPKAFNAALDVPAGVTSLVTAAGQAAGLVNGDMLMAYEGHPGWHAFYSEFVEVDFTEGDAILLKQKTRFPYNATEFSIGAFCRDHKFGGNPPGVTTARTWPTAGFRKVQPLKNVHLKCEDGGKISNLLTSTGAGGFAIFAVFAWCAINVTWENLDTQGGGLWALDCQDYKVKGSCRIDLPYVLSTLETTDRSLLVNGTNNILLEGLHLESCSLVIEEFCDTILIKQPTIKNGIIRGLAAARNVTIEGPINVTAPDGIFGASFGSGDNEFGIYNWSIDNISIFSDGACLLFSTQSALKTHPNIRLRYLPLVEQYYSGDQLRIRNARLVSEDQNPATIFSTQRIRCDNVEIGKNADADIASPFGVGAVIGDIRRTKSGQPVGKLKYSGSLPTFSARLGEIAYSLDGTAKKEVIYTRRRYEAITAQDGLDLTVAGFTEDGSYAVGDVVTFVVSDGGGFLTQVLNIVTTKDSAVVPVPDTTGMVAGMAVTGLMFVTGTTIVSVDSGSQITVSNPAAFTTADTQGHMITVGNRKAEHQTTLTAVDAGTSKITTADTIPGGMIAWLASFSAGGYLEVCRWG